MSKLLVLELPQRSAAGTSVLQKLYADSDGQLAQVSVDIFDRVRSSTHESMMSTMMQLPTPPILAPP